MGNVSAQGCTEEILQEFRKGREEHSLGYVKNDLSEEVGHGRMEMKRQKDSRSLQKCEQRLELKGAPPGLSKASS